MVAQVTRRCAAHFEHLPKPANDLNIQMGQQRTQQTHYNRFGFCALFFFSLPLCWSPSLRFSDDNDLCIRIFFFCGITFLFVVLADKVLKKKKAGYAALCALILLIIIVYMHGVRRNAPINSYVAGCARTALRAHHQTCTH